MIQSFSSLNPLLFTVVLATLAIGLPIITVLAIRFLVDRKLNVGRSKEVEKLIWQLHRIATALEHQLNLSFPAVQPGTEEPHDLAYLQQLAPHRMTQQSTAVPASQEPALREPPIREPSSESERAGVNSMFGF